MAVEFMVSTRRKERMITFQTRAPPFRYLNMDPATWLGFFFFFFNVKLIKIDQLKKTSLKFSKLQFNNIF